jgi:hypothetical protein
VLRLSEYRAADRAVHGFVAIAGRRIATGDHPFVVFVAKLTAAVVNFLYGTVRVSGTLSLCVE